VYKSIHVFQTYYTLRHTACPILAIANSALVSSPVVSHANKSRTHLVAYFAMPSSALKQSVNCLLCLLEAWSVSIFWLVVPWNVWKQVLHLMVWAAAFW
jgi:hypothetical protein